MTKNMTRGTELTAVPNRVPPQPKTRVEKKKLKTEGLHVERVPPLHALMK